MDKVEYKILYSNRQWDVVECDFGIFMHPQGRDWYQVPIHVFNEDGMDHVAHISKKIWCDIDEFYDVVRFLMSKGLINPSYDVNERFLKAGFK